MSIVNHRTTSAMWTTRHQAQIPAGRQHQAAGRRKPFFRRNMGTRSYIAFVVAKDGTPLMPCQNPKKVRILLKEKRARIFRHDPFTIQLFYESEMGTQPVEICEDTGYLNAGLSIKSGKHEYVREELTLLCGEKQRHMAQGMYRRQRRNRKRYRKPRFDNRKKPDGWLPPSLQHKAEAHVARARKYAAVLPISSVTIETGKFDTALLTALENGEFLEGTDYQHGVRYMKESQRIAIFERDGYACQVCRKNAFSDHAVLRLHHIGFRNGDRSNRAANLLTVCTRCHTPRNHKPGGKLWDIKPAGKLKADTAFMNAVRYRILEMFRESFPYIPVNTVYGAMTAAERKLRHIPKSHSNDAYAMGSFHPKHRACERKFRKRRRNNRVLEEFTDARYHDSRVKNHEDKEWSKTGQQLSSGRVAKNKNSTHNGENLRTFRGHKLSKGKRAIRKRRYPIRPGDIILVDGISRKVYGVHCGGAAVQYKDEIGKVRDKTVRKVKVKKHLGGWNETTE